MNGSAMRPLFTWRSAVVESDLPPTSRHVALTLSLHMNERGGSCFPSQQTLADETGLNLQTVAAHLKRLEQGGWLTKSVIRKGKGRGTRVEYEGRVPVSITHAQDIGDQDLAVNDHVCPDQTTTYVEDVRPPMSSTQVNNSPGVLQLEEPAATQPPTGQPSVELETPPAGIEAAKAIARWYWDGVKDRTGKPPAGIRFMALAKIIEPFLKHWAADEVRPALRAMYEAGQTITRQNLERHLDGRARKFGRGRQAHDAELAELQVDAEGNLVG